MVNSAKALLTAEKTKTNTHNSIIKDFDERFIASGKIDLKTKFEYLVLQLNKNEPTEAFAKSYLEDTKGFLKSVEVYRKQELVEV
jgi:sulfite reductase (ferredoxin)